MNNLVTRFEWGARRPKAVGVPHTPRAIVIHHTSAPTAKQWRDKSSMRAVQSHHMDANGWSDIGYHYVIGPDGVLYEGRPEGVIGAHAPPNTGRLGVCLVGNFEKKDAVTLAQHQALVALLRRLCSAYAIVPARITGHRDSSDTDCPGSSLYAMLPRLRKAVITNG